MAAMVAVDIVLFFFAASHLRDSEFFAYSTFYFKEHTREDEKST